MKTLVYERKNAMVQRYTEQKLTRAYDQMASGRKTQSLSDRSVKSNVAAIFSVKGNISAQKNFQKNNIILGQNITFTLNALTEINTIANDFMVDTLIGQANPLANPTYNLYCQSSLDQVGTILARQDSSDRRNLFGGTVGLKPIINMSVLPIPAETADLSAVTTDYCIAPLHPNLVPLSQQKNFPIGVTADEPAIAEFVFLLKHGTQVATFDIADSPSKNHLAIISENIKVTIDHIIDLIEKVENQLAVIENDNDRLDKNIFQNQNLESALTEVSFDEAFSEALSLVRAKSYSNVAKQTQAKTLERLAQPR